MKLKPVDLALIGVVVVMVVVGVAYVFSSGGNAGNEVTTDLTIDFFNAPAPINQGNMTTWSMVGGTWTANTTINNGHTVWIFKNITSDSNCYAQLLQAASIAGFTTLSENQTLGLIVTSIAGDSNLQYDGRAWQYFVNDVYANKACSIFALSDGDVVVWKYIQNQMSE